MVMVHGRGLGIMMLTGVVGRGVLGGQQEQPQRENPQGNIEPEGVIDGEGGNLGADDVSIDWLLGRSNVMSVMEMPESPKGKAKKPA